MKLIDDFCKIHSLNTCHEGFNAIVELLSNCPIYEGHFPAQPVVPGVFTLALIRECVSIISGCKMEYADIKECKFISALLPMEGLKVILDFSLLENRTLNGTVKKDSSTILKLKATLR